MADEAIRLYLHGLFETAFPGLAIYYRPPGNMKLDYPCIVYELKAAEPSYSNNEAYVVGIRYQITILSKLPGYPNTRNMFGISGIVIRTNRSYTSSNIVHDVFTVSVNSII